MPAVVHVPVVVPQLAAGISPADAGRLLGDVVRQFPVFVAALKSSRHPRFSASLDNLQVAMVALGYTPASDDDDDSDDQGDQDDSDGDDLLPAGNVTLPNSYGPPVYPVDYVPGQNFIYPPPLPTPYPHQCTDCGPGQHIAFGPPEQEEEGCCYVMLATEMELALRTGAGAGGYDDPGRRGVRVVRMLCLCLCRRRMRCCCCLAE